MKTFNKIIILFVLLVCTNRAFGQNYFPTVENVSGEWNKNWKFYKVVKLDETEGLTRINEPVDLEIDFSSGEIDSPEKEIRVIEKDFRSGDLVEIPSQVYILPDGKYHTAFLANVSANSQKEYRIYFGNPDAIEPNYESDLKVVGTVPQSIAENDFYIVDMTHGESGSAVNLCGQIRTITPKMGFNITFARRNGYVHYTPDCSRGIKSDGQVGAKYMNPPSNFYEVKGPIMYLVYRDGIFTEDDEFVKFTMIYKFYSSVPYIISQAVVEILKPTELRSLRTDELTFNSKIFTHNARKELDGNITTNPFPVERLVDGEIVNETDLTWPLSLPVNLPWLTFFNAEKGYGIASLHLDYQNLNQNGEIAPTLNERQQIRVGVQSNYWSRSLISGGPVNVAGGTKYTEKNAYLLYKIDPEITQMLAPVEKYYTLLKHPLLIRK